MSRIKLGYLALVKPSWRTSKTDAVADATFQALQSLDADILYEGIAATEAEARERARNFARAGVDGAVMHFVTFPVGAAIPAAAMEVDVPIVLLANPEEAGPGGMWERNSFCGANMASHGLRRLGKPYSFVFARPADLPREIAASMAALRAVKALRELRIGLVGGRVPGFYTSNADELQLRRDLGVTVEVLDLLEVVKTASALTAAELAAAREALGKAACRVNRIDEHELALAAGLYAAFRKTAEKYALNALAVRCWPECGDLFGVAPCAVLGMLNDHALPTSCEGDVAGAVTMEMLRAAAAGTNPPFFMDLIAFDPGDDTGVAWHCGAAPSSLCRSFGETELRRHMRVDGGEKKGVVNEFPLKAGRVTLARYDTDRDGRQRLLIAGGEALDTEAFLRGNPLRIRFDCSVKDLVDTVIDQGFEHHYALIHADVVEPLRQIARWKGISPVEPRRR